MRPINNLGFRHGALHLGEGTTRFRVWAPRASEVELRIKHPERVGVFMQRDEAGYWEAVLENVPPGARYTFRIDGRPDRPDPASRFQPEGVHAPSEVVGAAFDWQDRAWCGLPFERCVLYELHVGTFPPEGTFDAIIPSVLPYLRDLGVTFIELMPVAQFPGGRNWGYDGVYPFAVQDSYGGPEGLKRLVNECHKYGLGVVLDVVYNHLGPEGNYFADFGPYFTESYRTPWGPASTSTVRKATKCGGSSSRTRYIGSANSTLTLFASTLCTASSIGPHTRFGRVGRRGAR